MKLYFDSMMWVYYFEGHPQYGPPTRALERRLNVGGNEIIAGHLALAEVLVMPKRTRNQFAAAQYTRYFQSQSLRLVPFTIEVASRFAEIRASNRVKPADAIHLALASADGCDYFVTYDKALHGLNIPRITRICPPERVP